MLCGLAVAHELWINLMIMIPEGLPGAGGYREHDILIVTGDGAENITGFPFGPDHNVVGKVSAGR